MTPDERLAEISEFLRYALGTWPQESPRFTATLRPRCARCLVNDRYAPLLGGLCGDCRTGAGISDVAGADDIATRAVHGILASHVGSGSGAYDALVLFSGGKDSTYLLHRLRTEHPALRLLAVMVDNGFASSIALANVTRVATSLSVDCHVVRPQPGLYRRAFRHALTHLGTRGCYETVDRMDGDLTFDICRNLAAELRIPLMIAGLSREQVEGIFGFAGFESPREQECASRRVSAGFDLSVLFSDAECRHSWWDGARWDATRIPRVLYPLHAWNPGEDHIRAEIVRLGLVPEGADNPLATNSDLVPVMLAVDSARLGYSGFEPEFARMVRSGKADRTMWLNLFQALEHLAREGRFLPRCIDDTLARLGLVRAEVDLPAAPRVAAAHG